MAADTSPLPGARSWSDWRGGASSWPRTVSEAPPAKAPLGTYCGENSPGVRAAERSKAEREAAPEAAAVEKGAGDLKQLVGDACAPGVDPTRAGEALTVNDFSFN